MKQKLRLLLIFLFVILLQSSLASALSKQLTFATPEEAVRALSDAAASENLKALTNIFGEDFIKTISSGDPTADKMQLQQLSQRIAEKQDLTSSGPTTRLLEVGADKWPFPAPLVQKDGKWAFNSVIGAEEIINRRVGEDELRTIKVAQFYVDAQKLYYKLASKQFDQGFYAQKFISSPGQKDGLYWDTPDKSPSPLGHLVVSALRMGYQRQAKEGDGLFQGYYYRILKKQDEYASGKKMNYVSSAGRMTEGFALLAYPSRWNVSGVMSFIVGQDGIVYEKNFGAKTSQIAASISAYKPDASWHAITGVP